MKQRRWQWPRILAVGWLAGVGVAALLAPTSILTPDLLHTAAPPFISARHWLGTDPQGLDVAQALVLGARTLVLVSIPAAVLTLLLGAGLGSAAGFWGNAGLRGVRGLWLGAGLLLLGGVVLAPQLLSHPFQTGSLLALGSGGVGLIARRTRWGRRPLALPLDALVAALIALLDSVPLLVLVLVAAAVQRPSVSGLVLLMTLTCWTTSARLLRAATLKTREQTYVEAARVAGLSDWQLLRRHIWPVTWPVLLVRLPLTVALLIGLETTLSFLGVGLPPETPSWGRLLAAIRQSPTAWWLLVWPGLALVFTLLSLHRLSRLK